MNCREFDMQNLCLFYVTLEKWRVSTGRSVDTRNQSRFFYHLKVLVVAKTSIYVWLTCLFISFNLYALLNLENHRRRMVNRNFLNFQRKICDLIEWLFMIDRSGRPQSQFPPRGLCFTTTSSLRFWKQTTTTSLSIFSWYFDNAVLGPIYAGKITDVFQTEQRKK